MVVTSSSTEGDGLGSDSMRWVAGRARRSPGTGIASSGVGTAIARALVEPGPDSAASGRWMVKRSR